VVMPLNWKAFQRAYPSGEEPVLLQRLAAAAPMEASRPEPSGPHLREQLLAIPAGSARTELVRRHLTELLAGVLGLEPGAIDSTKTVGTLGLDSLMAVEFKNRCERSFELSLPATMVWNYPTIAALTAYMHDRLYLITVPTAELPHQDELVPSLPIIETRAAEVLRDVKELSEETALRELIGAHGT
jgi:acyl carrier protein